MVITFKKVFYIKHYWFDLFFDSSFKINSKTNKIPDCISQTIIPQNCLQEKTKDKKKDLRTTISGQVASTMKKSDLYLIALLLNIDIQKTLPIDKHTRDTLVNSIKTFLEENNQIVK